MEYTAKYQLGKPAEGEYADVSVLNENMDKVEAALGKKPDKTELPAEVKKAVQDGTLTAADLGAVSAADKGKPNGVAGLGSDGKVPQEQLPEMDYDAAGSADAVDKKLTAHVGDGVKHVTAGERQAWNAKTDDTVVDAHKKDKNNPHGVTAAQVGAAPLQGLPVNNIRKLTVRAGQSIKAGDVVDVEGGEVLSNVIKRANKNQFIYQPGISGIPAMVVKLAKISEQYSVYGYCPYDYRAHSTYQYARAVLVDNLSKSVVESSTIMIGSSDAQDNYASAIDIIPISESRFITAVEESDKIVVKLLEIKNDKIVQLGTPVTSFANSSYGMKCIKLNSSNKILMVYAALNYGQYAILQVTGDTISKVRDTDFRVFSNNSIAFINVMLLAENKVCIVACDKGNSNKPSAIVGNFNNSNNTMSFGTVAKSVFADAIQLRATSKGNTIYAMCYLTAEKKYVGKVLTVSGNTISIASERVEIDTTSLPTEIAGESLNSHLYSDDIFLFGEKIVTVTNSGLRIYQDDNAAPSKLKLVNGNAGWPTIISGGSWGTLSVIPINNTDIWYGYGAYQSSGLKPQAVITHLTVHNNVFANWVCTAKDAIALANGTGGQQIPVGFGGYCECPGITQGQCINSEGVSAFSPQDGWLDVVGFYGNRMITGSYTGNEVIADREINLGFKPKAVMLYGDPNDRYYSYTTFLMMFNDVAVGYAGKVVQSENGFTLKMSGSSSNGNWNQSGRVYNYIAWR